MNIFLITLLIAYMYSKALFITVFRSNDWLKFLIRVNYLHGHSYCTYFTYKLILVCFKDSACLLYSLKKPTNTEINSAQ